MSSPLRVFVTAGFIVLAGCSKSCPTQVFQRMTSPDGQVEATVRMTDCGATTGFSRVVWLKPISTADGSSKECRALALKGEPDVSLAWGQRGDLLVRYDLSRGDVVAASPICIGHRIKISRIKT